MPFNAAFSGLPTSGNKPLTVVFTDSSDDGGNVIIKWYWDFGDGFTSSEQNPTHIYRRAGTYTVALTVWDDIGNTDTETKINYISLIDIKIDINKFFATPDSTMRIDELKIYRGDKDYDEYFSSLAKTARKMNSY